MIKIRYLNQMIIVQSIRNYSLVYWTFRELRLIYYLLLIRLAYFSIVGIQFDFRLIYYT